MYTILKIEEDTDKQLSVVLPSEGKEISTANTHYLG